MESLDPEGCAHFFGLACGPEYGIELSKNFCFHEDEEATRVRLDKTSEGVFKLARLADKVVKRLVNESADWEIALTQSQDHAAQLATDIIRLTDEIRAARGEETNPFWKDASISKVRKQEMSMWNRREDWAWQAQVWSDECRALAWIPFPLLPAALKHEANTKWKPTEVRKMNRLAKTSPVNVD